MPRIFDNIDLRLLPTLTDSLSVGRRADFCVGYFNLRGWRQLDSHVERWTGEDESCCRLLVGMQKLPADEFRDLMRLGELEAGIDNATAIKLRSRLAAEFREQLTI